MRVWPLWFRVLLGIVLGIGVIFICAVAAHGQAPDAPSKVFTADFVATETIHWTGVLGDGISSAHYINHVGCTAEGNPLFRREDGKFKTGKYFAVNVPIAASITLLDVLVRRKTHNKYARFVMSAIATGNGVYHFREVLRYKSSGWGC